MSLADFCIPQNLAWREISCSAYHYLKETLSGNVEKTVFHYQIPFSKQDEAVYLAKYGLDNSERMGFYQNLVRCIQRNVDAVDYLRSHEVSSILTFSEVEQVRDENGVFHFYLESDRVYPILHQQLGSTEISAITAIDIIYRLSLIFRDINKYGMIHRGLDLQKVYLTADNKILLGGFYYASFPGTNTLTDYMPHTPPYLPKTLRNGGVGSQSSDIQSLSVFAWNLFSGGAYDLGFDPTYLVRPEYAPQQIVDTLLLGIRCRDSECNAFRRQWLNARKEVSKTAFAEQKLPLPKQVLIEFVVNCD